MIIEQYHAYNDDYKEVIKVFKTFDLTTKRRMER